MPTFREENALYNTLYDDENHGLEIWKERQSRRRAAYICRRVGLKISNEYLDQLELKQILRIIREGLTVLEAMESGDLGKFGVSPVSRTKRDA